jgi:hypothetical protein
MSQPVDTKGVSTTCHATPSVAKLLKRRGCEKEQTVDKKLEDKRKRLG